MRKATARAFVAVGSNIDPERNVREARRLLAARARVIGVSTVYRTKALRRPERRGNAALIPGMPPALAAPVHGCARLRGRGASGQGPGVTPSDDYYNCVVAIETYLPPLALRSELRKIEAALGRRRGRDKFAPRTIDLDLIAYEGVELRWGDCTLPDPGIWWRPFLAIPLAELAPEFALTGETRASEVAATVDGSGMTPLIEYTEQLRRDLRDEHPEG